jgi:hypothetical protein
VPTRSSRLLGQRRIGSDVLQGLACWDKLEATSTRPMVQRHWEALPARVTVTSPLKLNKLEPSLSPPVRAGPARGCHYDDRDCPSPPRTASS